MTVKMATVDIEDGDIQSLSTEMTMTPAALLPSQGTSTEEVEVNEMRTAERSIALAAMQMMVMKGPAKAATDIIAGARPTTT